MVWEIWYFIGWIHSGWEAFQRSDKQNKVVHQKVAMNTYTKYTIMVTLVLALGLIAYFLGGSEQDNAALKERTVEAISWEKTYDSKSKHPYGTFFIRSIFENGLDSIILTSSPILNLFFSSWA